VSDAKINEDLANPDEAFLADHYDIFTLDTTIIATGLGQLMDEGEIDAAAKPYLHVAITHQRHPQINHYSKETLDAISRVVNEA